MIIRNNFSGNKNNFGSRMNINDNNNNYFDQQKQGLRKSINNLDERYKNGEVDFEKFKKIANNYANQHRDLNQRINKNH